MVDIRVDRVLAQLGNQHGRYVGKNFFAISGVKGMQHAIVGADVDPLYGAAVFDVVGAAMNDVAKF